MSQERPWLVNDQRHFRECHERWIARLHRRMNDPRYHDEWYAEQCGACQYFVPLTGAFINDWGACTNPASPFDGRVMFEHDGCDQFSESDQAWGAISEAPVRP